MRTSSTQVRTENAQSYMRKLGQHWSHRFPVEFEGDAACRIRMPNAICELDAAPTQLVVRIMLEAEADRDRMEQVVEEHVKRFAFREQLRFDWQHETA